MISTPVTTLVSSVFCLGSFKCLFHLQGATEEGKYPVSTLIVFTRVNLFSMAFTCADTYLFNLHCYYLSLLKLALYHQSLDISPSLCVDVCAPL